MSNYEQVYSSTLSLKRIIYTTILFLGIPILSKWINQFIQNETISYTMVINIIGCILVMYNWNLIGIHYNRTKYNLKESLLYFIIGIIGITVWFLFNLAYIKGAVLTPDIATLQTYPAGIPIIFLAYGFVLPILTSMTAKCLTDRLPIKTLELQVIIVTGFAFSLFYVAFYVPIGIASWAQGYVFYTVLFMFISYLYNQSSSLLPGTAAYSLVLIVYFTIRLIIAYL
ncbi:MAG: hypothetical protein HUJ56_07300 [Erysipelotrichaceae bacterium]|nr:hypothetical protein [Erysipelotrichaceae bacterium]